MASPPAVLIWFARLVAWAKRHGIITVLALVLAGLLLASALRDQGGQPSAGYMRPR